MRGSVVGKILEEHIVEGNLRPGEEVSIRVDQVLTQDATGTMAWLQFEAIGVPKVRVPLVVSYVDHNTFQADFRNPDDHRFLQTAAAKYGAFFSPPGNGICHQVHLERFAAPGAVLLGSDSHTPTAGGIGALAIGVGGIDVAVAMAGMPYGLRVPEVVRVYLTGKLRRPWVTAMDVILELLRRLTVKGGVGKVLEYAGPGVSTLSVTERATITNMGAELGATTSVFPSDERTRAFLKAQGRGDVWRPLEADPDAQYSDEIHIDLGELEPLVARPHSPDNVAPVREVEGLRVDQVAIGGCTNSSYQTMKAVAAVLKGRKVAPRCSLALNPGSRQVLAMLAREGDLADMISAGARLLEPACGPCIGMGYAPPTGGVSLRSYNRNFRGRCGTPSAEVYLASPLTCAVSALRGALTDPRKDGIPLSWPEEPESFPVDDGMILPPSEDPESVEVIRGPNIQPVPLGKTLEGTIRGEVLLKLGDDISTDDVLPAGAHILPLRSNIPEISKFTFSRIDPSFSERARKAGVGFIVAGENYGQGSSREHAAIAPMYLGIRAVLAKSFARIHRSNLINWGILPLELEREEDYEAVRQGDVLELRDVLEGIEKGQVQGVLADGRRLWLRARLTERERELLKAGGLLAYARGRLA